MPPCDTDGRMKPGVRFPVDGPLGAKYIGDAIGALG
jgi:hypothetical protein